MIKEIARLVAMEICEIHVPKLRQKFKFPDDINGDTYDRAMCCAKLIVLKIKDELDK